MVWTIWKPTFKMSGFEWNRFSNGRILDPYCTNVWFTIQATAWIMHHSRIKPYPHILNTKLVCYSDQNYKLIINNAPGKRDFKDSYGNA